MLQLTKAGINMFNDIDACINFIKSQAGVKFIGWYKRGKIDDQSLIAARNVNYIGTTSLAMQKYQ